jgi:hypothetical protein
VDCQDGSDENSVNCGNFHGEGEIPNQAVLIASNTSKTFQNNSTLIITHYISPCGEFQWALNFQKIKNK